VSEEWCVVREREGREKGKKKEKELLHCWGGKGWEQKKRSIVLTWALVCTNKKRSSGDLCCLAFTEVDSRIAWSFYSPNLVGYSVFTPAPHARYFLLHPSLFSFSLPSFIFPSLPFPSLPQRQDDRPRPFTLRPTQRSRNHEEEGYPWIVCPPRAALQGLQAFG